MVVGERRGPNGRSQGSAGSHRSRPRSPRTPPQTRDRRVERTQAFAVRSHVDQSRATGWVGRSCSCPRSRSCVRSVMRAPQSGQRYSRLLACSRTTQSPSAVLACSQVGQNSTPFRSGGPSRSVVGADRLIGGRLGIERDNGAERALFGRSFTNDGPRAPHGTSRSALPALRGRTR